MSYHGDLNRKIRTIKAKLDKVHLDIKDKLKQGLDIDQDIRKRNNLNVDLQTVKSRIKNYGREVYLPNIQKLD